MNNNIKWAGRGQNIISRQNGFGTNYPIDWEQFLNGIASFIKYEVELCGN